MGLEWAGFTIAWQCELDAWKRQILAAHWPDVPIFDDITTLHDPPPVDMMIGGFPCQDLSIAGKRKGFQGERSVLAFDFLRIVDAIQPRWLLLENVPGLFSSAQGADFARLIDEMADAGYGVAWRILDARYFNVPQRRRRAFICARRADAGIDPRAASGLALRALSEGSGGDPTPGWPPRPEATADTRTGADAGGIFNATAAFGAWVQERNARELSQRDYKSPNHLVSFRKSKRAQSDQDDETWIESDSTNTLNRFDTGDTRATQIIASALDRQAGGPDDNSAQANHLIPNETTVRRLTPTECEALMGWPRNHTAPPGVKAPDSKRYAACGDGIVSWVAYWIGQRIQMIEAGA